MIVMDNLSMKWKETNFDRILKNSHAIEIHNSNIEKAAEFAEHFVVTGICKSSQESFLTKVLKRVAKSYAAMVLIVGTSPENSTEEWISFIRYCAEQLPPTTAVIAVHNGNIISATCSIYNLQGSKFVSRPRFYINENNTSLMGINSFFRKSVRKDMNDLRNSEAFMSVLQWTINLQRKSLPKIHQNSSIFRSNKEMVNNYSIKNQDSEFFTSEDESFHSSMSSKYEISSSSSSFSIKDSPLMKDEAVIYKDREFCSQSPSNANSDISLIHPINVEIDSRKLPKELELVIKTNSASCRLFSYKELKIATCDFSSENMIGEGGCSIVYKGSLPRGKPIAIKVLKSHKEAWNDFTLEMEIVSSLKHKHITSLIGVCFEDNHIIAIYDFMPRGSIEEHLHGNRKKRVLSWEVRFKAAVVVAEALDYLHNECSPPIIHRDVKSSNILLTQTFEAQLSDFGLATRGSIDSTYSSHTNVLGTFGYIAPEYIMHGNVSDKIDVYSFGIVLLELTSGRRPIGQENLVKWAKKLIDSRNLKALMDPKLGAKFDIVQMHKVVLAATLCINQSARHRPTIRQILQLLNGEKDTEEWFKFYINSLRELCDQEDDILYPEFSSDPQLNYTLLDLNDNASVKNIKQKHSVKLKDYLKETHV